MGTNGQSPRVVLAMLEEDIIDNVFYARETMEKTYNLKPENLSDVIAILLNYWFTGKREL
jgi:hypothetical protein